jgi:hypothetical protein
VLPSYVPRDVADSWQIALRNQIQFPSKRPVIVHGVNEKEPRDVVFQGDSIAANMRYGPLNRPPQSVSSVLLQMFQWMQSIDYIKVCGRLPLISDLNVALISRFKNGKDYIGWHHDRMACLGKDPLIVSLSLGATRVFQLRNIYSNEKRSCTLTHGTVVIMLGRELQENWKHRVPQVQGRQDCLERWNVSLRHHLGQAQTLSIESYQKANGILPLANILDKFL